MFDRPGSGTRAVLVSLALDEGGDEQSLNELKLLATSAGATVAGVVRGRRRRPDAALFAGSGKVDEIAAAAQSTAADLIIFNHELSPAQERNLERRFERRVIDRVSLILDIFAQRARSHEGKLQVELAQLEHLATRLVRGWTHLERQKGGIGLRGPGETQLETDRRLLGKRVKVLKDKLVKLDRQRATQRRARQRAHLRSVSLVGYTNAGKSTLFNRLTRASVHAADQLFATLDPTTRRLHGADGRSIVLSDTVGFIQNLPHTLVAAFRATLDETVRADLLLHVVDAGNPDRDLHIAEVNKVLTEIGAAAIPQILIMNKIDITGAQPRVERDECGTIARIWVSAATGAGVELVRQALAERLTAATADGLVATV